MASSGKRPQAARIPRKPLYRIGRAPDPLSFPPWSAVGKGRFDDPLGAYRVLYAAERRIAAFLESLQVYRPDLKTLALMTAKPGPPFTSAGLVPADWNMSRRVGRLRLDEKQFWLDLRSIRTAEVLRVELAQTLLNLGIDDLDVNIARSTNRQLTQAISRWAYDQGYQGIKYTSRFRDDYACWALFEGVQFSPDGPPEFVSQDDVDLARAAQIFDLRLES